MRKIKDLYVHYCFDEDVDGNYLIEGYEILDKLGEDEWKQVGWIDYEEIGEEDYLEKIDDLRLEQLVEKGMYSKPIKEDVDDNSCSPVDDNLSIDDWINMVLLN